MNQATPTPKGAYLIPAYQAERTLGVVLRDLHQAMGEEPAPILVVDDGSHDDTSEVARRAGAHVLRHEKNRGKGQGLKAGLQWARENGVDCVVTLDADGQHPPAEAVRLMRHQNQPTEDAEQSRSARPAVAQDCREVFVLAVRDLAAAGAPIANQRSNAFSNRVLSLFSGKKLLDTQCGLRRYPVERTLKLGAKSDGYAFEAEVVLRAARRGERIEQVPTHVLYPKGPERVTHFDSVKDPARIVGRVVATTLSVPHHRWTRRWGRRFLYLTAGMVAALFVAHRAVRQQGIMMPPEVTVPHVEPQGEELGLRTLGSSYAFRRQQIWEVGLAGTPERIGWAHGRLLHHEMVRTEGVLFSALETYVPSTALRALLLDTAIWAYRDVDQGMRDDRLREIAAQSRAFSPDPFAGFLPTYQRFVYLNALYDIALSFEHSPLIGCTTFTASKERSSSGSPLLARAFDFEVDDVFDERKAVFFVREEGKIPFASVAWPGLVGVVSGMNLAGLAVVVHGARAGPTAERGEPVVHALRRVLSEARNSKQAVQLLERYPKLVSHLVILNDAEGRALAVERVVGTKAHVRPLSSLDAVTNHLEGPFSDHHKNEAVMAHTSTLNRKRRGDALVNAASGPVDERDMVRWLRDRSAPDGTPLPPGDRRAIDAVIATHGVVMSTKERKMWVSQSPHLLGGFVEYDLEERLREGYRPDPHAELPTLPADPRRAAVLHAVEH